MVHWIHIRTSPSADKNFALFTIDISILLDPDALRLRHMMKFAMGQDRRKRCMVYHFSYKSGVVTCNVMY